MSVERLLNVMKQAGTGAVEAGNPVAILFGVVETADPLAVRVDQRFTLTAEFFVIPESLIHYELELRHDHKYTDSSDSGTATKTTEPALPEEPIIIRRGLEEGDRLLLLRMQGGQQYVILDRVVSA
jgi:hypothetical protein